MTNRHITQPPKSWQEGFNAGRRWLPRKNPYPIHSDDALAWVSGYIEGTANRSRQRMNPDAGARP